MGEIKPTDTVLMLLAAFSRHRAALDWSRERAEAAWGPIALVSPEYEFRETDYYHETMGSDLRKMFFVFDSPFDPAKLASRKVETNQWELDYRQASSSDEQRPLNLDPGYLTLAKLVLASTKDHAHRVYLECGIYAEVTLHYQDRAWQHHNWTFPDYRRADYQSFFTEARELLRSRARRERGG